jgi:hypothetical protein
MGKSKELWQLLFSQGFQIVQEAGHFLDGEIVHQGGRHDGSGQGGAFLNLCLFDGVLIGGDVADAHFVAGFLGYEAHDGLAVLQGEEVGCEALGDGLVWIQDGEGEVRATVCVNDVAKVGAFLGLVLACGVTGDTGGLDEDGFAKGRVAFEFDGLGESFIDAEGADFWGFILSRKLDPETFDGVYGGLGNLLVRIIDRGCDTGVKVTVL